MADRYWVGGTASWDGTAGLKWASTSGGAGGESVPTTADAVFFDSNSSGSVTIAASNTGAASIDCTGFTGTLTGSAAITVAGSVTLDAGQTYTHTGTMTFTGTGTLTTAGKTFSGVTVDGSGITVTLGDALTVGSRAITVTQGELDTASYSVTAGQLLSNNSNTRAITLGSSTVTLSSATAVDFTVSTGLTFTANTSQINLSNASATLSGGGKTFYNVSFTSGSSSSGVRSIVGANTFNDLTLNASGIGLSQLSTADDQTVSGTFTCAGSSAIARGFVRSNTIGTTRTITAAAVSANDCDFRDITIAGGAAPVSPTRAGNCGGNSGITFPAAKTVYRVGASTQWQGSSSWALSSGGAGSDDNYPLPQDTAVFDNDGSLPPAGIGVLYPQNLGSVDCSAQTNALTLGFFSTTSFYGSVTLGSGITLSGTTSVSFLGRGTMVFTSAGKNIPFETTVDAPGGTFQLGDAYAATNFIVLTRGTLDANDYNVTCTTFSSNNSNTRTLTLGGGLWTLSGTGSVWNVQSSGLTLNKNSGNILLSSTSTNTRTFQGGGLPYNKLTIGGATGTSVLELSAADSFTEIAATKPVAHTIRLASDLGVVDSWSAEGSLGNVVTLESSSAGVRRTFSLNNVTSGIDYLNVTDIGVNNADRFYVGANSVDGGNNVNVLFSDAPALDTDSFFLLL